MTEVKLYKNIGGQMQLLQTVDATQGDSYTSSTLSWKALPVANLDVALQVAVKGSGNWNALTPTLVGNRYVASLTSLAANQYEYQITYTRQGETEPLLSATGEFDVLISNVAGSSTLVNFVEDQDASASFTPAVFDFQSTVWQSDNVINLNWTSLMGYGGGNVYIEVDFQAKELQGSGTVPRTWSSGSVAWSNAMTGYQATISPAGEVYAIVDSITAVRIYKVMPNSQQQLIRQLSNPNTPKLMLTGNVTDLSSIIIDGIGSRAAVNLGNGYYQVDLSGLANGTYTFTSNQTPALTGSFTVADSYNPGELRLSEPQGSTAVLGLIQPEISQHHDRWGNVLSLTDALGALTTYQYDYRNQLTQETKPEVTVYGENGVGIDKVTTTIYQYDALGRLLQVTDDRENQTSRKYDDAGQVVAEYQADGGVMTHEYDNMGRKVADTDANGHRTEYVYDMKDQLTDVIRTTGTTQYAYDAWGKRYKTTNALGETMYEVRSAEGRITQTYYADGRQVQVAYNKDDKKVQEISTAPNTTTITKEWLYDIHGNLLLEAVTGDFGAHLSGTHLTSYKYNSDGTVAEIKGETGSGTTTKHQVYTYYANGQVKSVTDIAEGGESLFTYDANGRQSYERYTKNNNVVQDTLVKYDDLGRVTFVQDNDFLMEYGYDENGNRRFVIGSYLDNTGNPKTVENWYTYDNENRILISQGERVEVSPGVFEIQATTNQGVQLSYDGQGNRRIAYFYDNNEWVTENYVYDESNRLIRTTRNGDLTSIRSYDGADRMTAYTSYSSPGVINESRTMEYDENGWLQTQKNYGSNGELKYTVSYTDYDVTGQVLQYRVNLEGVEHDQIYTYYYVLNASGVQTNTITAQYDGGNQTGTTTHGYDLNGYLTQVTDSLGNNNTRSFVTNANGQILTKLENGNTQRYFYVQGKTIASVNGTNGKADFDYNYTPVSDSYPASTPSAYVVSQGDTLQSIALAVYGDAQLWYLIADANGLQDNSNLELGKTLVIPNRITNIHNTADTFKPYNPASIIGDTTPTLPDPPPVAGSAGGCGIVGTIIMIVVAVVATIITAGAAFAAISGFSFSGGALFTAGAAVLGGAGGAAGLAAAAIGGAVGSIASQLVGMALGVQEDFSWSGVAAGAIGSAFTAGIGAAAKGTFLAKEGFANGLARGAINNVASQGAQMLTGGDKNFNWASLAANSLANGLTNTRGFRSKFGTIEGPDGVPIKGAYADPLLSRLAQGVVYQGTQSAVNKLFGESGKVDWTSMAADSFGNILADGLMETAGGFGSDTLEDVLSTSAGVGGGGHPSAFDGANPFALPDAFGDDLASLGAAGAASNAAMNGSLAASGGATQTSRDTGFGATPIGSGELLAEGVDYLGDNFTFNPVAEFAKTLSDLFQPLDDLYNKVRGLPTDAQIAEKTTEVAQIAELERQARASEAEGWNWFPEIQEAIAREISGEVGPTHTGGVPTRVDMPPLVFPAREDLGPIVFGFPDQGGEFDFTLPGFNEGVQVPLAWHTGNTASAPQFPLILMNENKNSDVPIPQIRENDITAGMELDPTKASVYRGGTDFTVKPNEVKIDKVTGLVKPTHGVSLDVNPATLEKWGPQQIQSIPSELKIIQRGRRLEHFEVVPREPMTLERFQELLNKINVFNGG